MRPPEPNDPLDTLLREGDAHVDDAGFTARVIAKLPPPRRPWLRPVILLGACIIGLGWLIWSLPSLNDLVTFGSGSSPFVSLSISSLLTIAALITVCLTLFWSLLAMIKWED